MIEVARALYQFYSMFGVPAYTEDNVPSSETEKRYITYSLIQPDTYENAIHTARVWDYSTSSAWILETVDKIISLVGEGISIMTDKGTIVIRPGSPLIQEMIAEDPEDRSAIINFQLNVFQTKGVE